MRVVCFSGEGESLALRQEAAGPPNNGMKSTKSEAQEGAGEAGSVGQPFQGLLARCGGFIL